MHSGESEQETIVDARSKRRRTHRAPVFIPKVNLLIQFCLRDVASCFSTIALELVSTQLVTPA